MNSITLNREDFIVDGVDGCPFDDFLAALGVEESKRADVDYIELRYSSFAIW